MIDYNRILCAVDFSPSSPTVARHARTLASAMNLDLLVLHVVSSLQRFADLHVSSEAVGEFIEGVREGAERHMDDFLEKHFGGIQKTGMVRTGYPPDVIVETAKEFDCGLIVMGALGRSGLERMLTGSVADKVVRLSPVPVLTVRGTA